MNRNLIAKYHQRAKLASFLLQFVPFIRLIALTGSLARHKVNKNSDIDFFIITQRNRLWIVRFAAIAILDLFNSRAKDESTSGKICLNRFLTDKNFLLSPHNSFHAREYARIITLFDHDNYYQQFIRANHHWMSKYTKLQVTSYKLQVTSYFLPTVLRWLLEKILAGKRGNWLENKLRQYQVKKIASNPFFQQKSSRLKISEEEFYYHQNPR